MKLNKLVDNYYTITNIHKTTLTYILINSIKHKLNTISNKINKSGNYSNSTKFYYKLSINIEHIDIKSTLLNILTYFPDLISVFLQFQVLYFRNDNAYVYIINSLSKFDFFIFY